MKKNMLVFLLLSIVMCLLAGCNRPVLMSMGTAPLPVYHEPRWSGEQDKNWVISGDVFVGPYGEGLNIREVFSMGGDLSVMYRFMNPLFVQASFAGAMGDLRFACSDTPCTSRYYSWRDKHDEKYVFWTLQERVLLGSDFVFGGIVQAGFGMGVQFYHADGQYESAREDLEDSDSEDFDDEENDSDSDEELDSDENQDSEVDFENMSLAELKSACKERGIDVKNLSKKADYINALKAGE